MKRKWIGGLVTGLALAVLAGNAARAPVTSTWIGGTDVWNDASSPSMY